jgi:hypothetical protein
LKIAINASRSVEQTALVEVDENQAGWLKRGDEMGQLEADRARGARHQHGAVRNRGPGRLEVHLPRLAADQVVGRDLAQPGPLVPLQPFLRPGDDEDRQLGLLHRPEQLAGGVRVGARPTEHEGHALRAGDRDPVSQLGWPAQNGDAHDRLVDLDRRLGQDRHRSPLVAVLLDQRLHGRIGRGVGHDDQEPILDRRRS